MKLKTEALLRYLCLLMFILFPLGQLARIQIGLTSAIYLHDLVLAIVLVLWLYYRWILVPGRHKPRFELFIPVFLLIGIASQVANFYWVGDKAIIGSLYLARWVLYAMLYPLLYDLLVSRIFRINIKQLLTGITLTVAFIGLLQFIFLPDTRFLAFYG